MKPIEEIEVGDMVWAYDEETGESDWKPVVRLFRNEAKEWYHVFVEGEEIVCTGGHPFYVLGIGFVDARNLKTSDKLLLSNGKEVKMVSFGKKRKKVDLEKGKQLFFECKGSVFSVDRDWGEEYYNCNIPKHLEEEWRKEIERNK